MEKIVEKKEGHQTGSVCTFVFTGNHSSTDIYASLSYLLLCTTCCGSVVITCRFISLKNAALAGWLSLT